MQTKNRILILPLALTALLPGACASGQAPAQQAESAADSVQNAGTRDAAEQQWMFGTSTFNCMLDGDAAQQIIGLMQQGEEIPNAALTYCARNFALSSMSGDSAEYRLQLSAEEGWVVTDTAHIWRVSDDTLRQLVHTYYTDMREQGIVFTPVYDGGAFEMQASDIAEGMVWLSVALKGSDSVSGVPDYSLKDEAGNEIAVLLIANDAPSVVPGAKLHALADASQMPAGKYTLTLGSVSTEFQVVDTAAYIQANQEKE